MKKEKLGLFCFAVLIIMLPVVAACANIPTANTVTLKSSPPIDPEEITGDPQIGRALFHGEKKLKGVVPCSVCHYVGAGQRILVGPNLHGISQVAGSRVPDQSAIEYLERSIREPEDYTVKGFPPGTMNEKYDERLSDEHVQDIIAYLLTL
jgi:cytochrome c2